MRYYADHRPVKPPPTIATSQSISDARPGLGVSGSGMASSHMLRARYRASSASCKGIGPSALVHGSCAWVFRHAHSKACSRVFGRSHKWGVLQAAGVALSCEQRCFRSGVSTRYGGHTRNEPQNLPIGACFRLVQSAEVLIPSIDTSVGSRARRFEMMSAAWELARVRTVVRSTACAVAGSVVVSHRD